MTTEPTTTTTREHRQATIDRARALGFNFAPIVSGNVHSATETGWAAATRHATEHELSVLDAELRYEAERQDTRAERERRAAVNGPGQASAHEALDQERSDDAQEAHERANTADARLERVEAMLIEIRDGLQRRG